MSFFRVDNDRKPIRGRSRRKPVSKVIRGEVHYLYRFRYYGPVGTNGRKPQKRATRWCRDDAAAEAVERELKGEAPRDSVTWSQAWDKYRRHVAPRRSPGHIENQKRDIDALVAALGDIDVEATSLRAFVSFLDQRSEQSSGRQAQMARSTAISIANWLIGRGEIDSAPFLAAPRPEHSAKKRAHATAVEWAAVAECLPEHARLFWRMLGYTGARITGMANLKKSDIFDGYLEVTTKGQKVKRYSVDPGVQDVLAQADEWRRAQLATHQEKRQRAHQKNKGILLERFRSSPYIFLTSLGTRWTRTSFYHLLETTWDSVPECPRITPHQLRHMAGTIAGELGYSQKQIQSFLGHSDVRSAEFYVDQTQQMSDAVSSSLGHYLLARDTFVTLPSIDSTHLTPPVATSVDEQPRPATCPHCGHKFLPDKGKARKSI